MTAVLVCLSVHFAPQIHHGNGTQKAFYDDDRVLFVSLHRRDKDFYPEVRRPRQLSISEKDSNWQIRIFFLSCGQACARARQQEELGHSVATVFLLNPAAGMCMVAAHAWRR